jgi:hypothetical protein
MSLSVAIVKKKVAVITPRLRMALLQGMENDEIVPAAIIVASVPNNAPLVTGDITQNASITTSIVSEIKTKNDDVTHDITLRKNISAVKKVNSLIPHTTELGTSNADTKNDGNTKGVAMQCKSTNFADYFMRKEASKFISKQRTALFKGGEDDEHIAPQIIQLESFLFDATKTMMKEGANTATLETKLIFR